MSETTRPRLRSIDLGPASTALDALDRQGVRPEELLTCEVFYDPQMMSSREARASVVHLDAFGGLPVSAVPASVAVLGQGATRLQATALAAGARACYDVDGRWAAGEGAFATRLVEAPGEGDIIQQSHAVLQEIAELLEFEGLDLDDVVKFNIYYRGEGTQDDWATAARVRAGYFTEPGPATTGIPVPGFEDETVLIAMQVLALRGVRENRRHSWPEDHWDWPFHLPYKHGNRAGGLAFVGGQVPLDGQARSLHVGDFPAQVRRSLEYIDRVLAELDVPRSAVQRLTAYVATTPGDAPDKLAALQSEAATYFGPGAAPAIVPVPLPVLAYPDMDVEIELQALVD